MKVPRVTRKPAVLQPGVAAIGGLALLLALATAGLAARVHAQSTEPTTAPPTAQAAAQSPPQPVAPTPPQPAATPQTATANSASPAPASESASKTSANLATEPAGDGHEQQINGQCADLLKMATALKSEIDKTTMDELSVSVVRKADEIEQLARKLKGEIKLPPDK